MPQALHDVIVIGTGAGGGVVIKTLCDAGLKVCAEFWTAARSGKGLSQSPRDLGDESIRARGLVCGRFFYAIQFLVWEVRFDVQAGLRYCCHSVFFTVRNFPNCFCLPVICLALINGNRRAHGDSTEAINA